MRSQHRQSAIVIAANLRQSRLPTNYVEMTIDAFEKGLGYNGRAAELLELSRAAFDAFYRRRRRAREVKQVEEGLERVVA